MNQALSMSLENPGCRIDPGRFWGASYGDEGQAKKPIANISITSWSSTVGAVKANRSLEVGSTVWTLKEEQEGISETE